ncbi:spermidine synthase [Thiorhodococcus minor]|uniref:Spermidine synthase n=1 Tax=Thiorhodococcus minor TaxID=57489 RepID=A0A6M0K2C8_9GAMM|nr:spermidine synthase [Thiorhodococcus minor]NEV62727.1 spermidine synthase [Thiorhodococcus minor]
MLTKDQFTAIVMALVVWGFAGALFGALFAGLYQVLVVLGLTGWEPLVIAAAAAAMTTSAFYSAMPVALVGAMAGVLASIGYLIASGQEVQLLAIVGTAAVFGVIAGSFYSWIAKSGSRPLAETLTGLLAGLLAGTVLALVLGLLGTQIGMFVLAAGVVALVGTFFQMAERWLVGRSLSWLPDGLAAPVVAGLIAAVVGASIWIVGGTTSAMLDLGAKQEISDVLRDIPPGLTGGLLGGALTGILLELLGFHLEDQI